MVKSKKSVFIVLITLAAMFLTATLVLLFVPEPQPLTITEKFYITETQNGFELHGKIRNDSGEDRTFKHYGQQVTVTLHINDLSGGTEYDKDYEIFNEEVTVKADESYEINKELDIPCQAEITKVTAHLSKKNYSVDYTLYGNVINKGNFLIAAVFVGIAGGSLLIGAIANLIANIKTAKRANQIIRDISHRFGNAIYAAGYYGDKKQERANAAKSAFGVIGGATMQLVTGLGVYRTYSGRRRRDFVITDNALFEVVGKEQNYYDIKPQVWENFKNAEIIEKRNQLTMNGADGKSYFTFKINNDEKQKLTDALYNLFKDNK